MNGTVFCAIGDIHGELDRLISLHRQIERFAAETLPRRPIHMVHLGDLVDRGADSCGVVEYLMRHEGVAGGRSITLRGNHEQMMLDALQSDTPALMRHWQSNGGEATIESYLEAGFDGVPEAHLDWLAGLPSHFHDSGTGLFFVHAGVDPHLFPDCAEETRLWTRQKSFLDPRYWTAPELDGLRIIHGHTPTRDSWPEVTACRRRVNIDTGAVYGGRLTAAMLVTGQEDVFLHS